VKAAAQLSLYTWRFAQLSAERIEWYKGQQAERQMDAFANILLKGKSLAEENEEPPKPKKQKCVGVDHERLYGCSDDLRAQRRQALEEGAATFGMIRSHLCKGVDEVVAGYAGLDLSNVFPHKRD
jgi:hypothetical protein